MDQGEEGISRGSSKIGSSRTDFDQRNEKNVIDLPRDERYAQILSYLHLQQSNSFYFRRPYCYYYQRHINSAA